MKKVVMYDPGVNAYREISIDSARKLIEEAEKLKAILIAEEEKEKLEKK